MIATITPKKTTPRNRIFRGGCINVHYVKRLFREFKQMVLARIDAVFIRVMPSITVFKERPHPHECGRSFTYSKASLMTSTFLSSVCRGFVIRK